jgi:hypothetical protein
MKPKTPAPYRSSQYIFLTNEISIDHSSRERREHRVFTQLLRMIAGLEERLLASSDEEAAFIAELVGLQAI